MNWGNAVPRGCIVLLVPITHGPDLPAFSARRTCDGPATSLGKQAVFTDEFLQKLPDAVA